MWLNQTYLYQTDRILTQTMPQTSAFIFLVQSFLKWFFGSSRWDEHLAWRGQLRTRLRFCSKLEIKKYNAHICGTFCGKNNPFNKVSLKLFNKALSKTFCLNTVNFFYSHTNENVNFLCYFWQLLSQQETDFSGTKLIPTKLASSYFNHPFSSKNNLKCKEEKSISNTAVELLSVPFIAVLQSKLIDSKIFFEKKKKKERNLLLFICLQFCWLHDWELRKNFLTI